MRCFGNRHRHVGQGQIVDASLIAAPRQRNTREEKAIKAERILGDWKDKPAKLRQKN
jgi:transposase, IS5 family